MKFQVRLFKKLKVLQLEFRREPTAYPRRGFQPPLKCPSHRRQELTVYQKRALARNPFCSLKRRLSTFDHAHRDGVSHMGGSQVQRWQRKAKNSQLVNLLNG